MSRRLPAASKYRLQRTPIPDFFKLMANYLRADPCEALADQQPEISPGAAVTHSSDAAGKPCFNTVISYVDHGFHCEKRPSYNAVEAWALTLTFFQEKLR